MPSSRHRLSFGRFKDRFTSDHDHAEDKPSRSSSLPNFHLSEKIRSLGRSNSLKRQKSQSLHSYDSSVDEEGVMVDREPLHDGCSLEADKRPTLHSNPAGTQQSSTSAKHRNSTYSIAESERSSHSAFAPDESRSVSSSNTACTNRTSPISSNSGSVLDSPPAKTPFSTPPSALEEVYSASSPGSLSQYAERKGYLLSPVDESFFSILRELEDGELFFDNIEPPLDTIFEEEGSEFYHPTTVQSSASSDSSSDPSPQFSLSYVTQQEREPVHDTHEVMRTPACIRLYPISHAMRDVVREWEDERRVQEKSYVEELPPLARLYQFKIRPVPQLELLAASSSAVLSSYYDYDGVD
ncbi:hypothetical protein BC835DRAFT_1410250 [Cytidiella melzeri]|nr:hypothetical protein BC835DRAFT_1410250 [Cytidiella melzeri]